MVNTEVYEDVKSQVYNGKIYCFCSYEKKDIVKNLGFKFDGELKLWYLSRLFLMLFGSGSIHHVSFQSLTLSLSILLTVFTNFKIHKRCLRSNSNNKIHK